MSSPGSPGRGHCEAIASWDVGPRHQGVDVFVEVAVCQFREEIAAAGVGLNAVHLACADQAGVARPVSAALIVAGEKGVAAVHGRAADRVFDKVCVHVDAAIVKKQAKAVLALQQIGHSLAQIGFARHAFGLGSQPCKELIDQRPGEFLPHRLTRTSLSASNSIFDLVKCGDAQQRLIPDG